MEEPEGPGANVPARRAADDPGYIRLADFKRDLRDMVSATRGGRLPDFRSIAHRIEISSSTAHSALNPDNLTRLSEETARKLVQEYDPSGLDYWLKRYTHLNGGQRLPNEAAADSADAVRTSSSASETAIPEPVPPQVGVLDTQEMGSARGKVVGVITGLVIVVGVAVGVSWNLSSGNDETKSSSTPAAGAGVSDYSDPISADCTNDAERVKSNVAESVGLVSIVHSPSCDAYWARAERTDGRELGNHIDISLTAEGSDRSPAVANDPNATVVYTYLLTTKQTSVFCVKAAFWVGDEAMRIAPFCVSSEP